MGNAIGIIGAFWYRQHIARQPVKPRSRRLCFAILLDERFVRIKLEAFVVAYLRDAQYWQECNKEQR